jgi:hypothetical protein
MDCKNLSISVSATLGTELIHWRNDAVDTEATCTRIVFGLGITALALLAIIETVVRAILTIPALPFIYCLPESEIRYMLTAALPLGVLCGANALAGYFNVMASNVCEDGISILNSIPNCMRDLNHLIYGHFEGIGALS